MNTSANQNYAQREQFKKIIALTEEMKEQAFDVNNALYGQTQQLQRIQGKTDQIGEQIKKADKISKRLTSFWYSVKERVKITLGFGSSDEVKEKPIQIQHKQGNQAESNEIANNDKICELVYNEQDEMLEQMCRNVKIAKNECIKMREELNKQDQIIGRIDNKVTQAQETTNKINKRLHKKFF